VLENVPTCFSSPIIQIFVGNYRHGWISMTLHNHKECRMGGLKGGCRSNSGLALQSRCKWLALMSV